MCGIPAESPLVCLQNVSEARSLCLTNKSQIVSQTIGWHLSRRARVAAQDLRGLRTGPERAAQDSGRCRASALCCELRSEGYERPSAGTCRAAHGAFDLNC